MPKTLLFSLVSVIALLSLNIRTGTGISYEGEKEMYFLSASSNCKIVGVQSESEFVYFMPALKGESVKLYRPQDKDEILKKYSAKEVFSERAGNIVNRYYYSPKISRFTTINGKKVNLQIADSNGEITVGIPLIFGSY